MARATYVFRNGKCVPKYKARPRETRQNATGVISDIMDPTWHPIDGKRYDSKAQFRQVTRAHGCVEVGNEKMTPRKPRAEIPDRVYREQIERSIYELQNPWAKR